jgi:hypothetical protein
VLRKGKDPDKLALLYEVIAEDTSEEGTSKRRQPVSLKPKRQLELLPSVYPKQPYEMPHAAEPSLEWDDGDYKTT